MKLRGAFGFGTLLSVTAAVTAACLGSDPALTPPGADAGGAGAPEAGGATDGATGPDGGGGGADGGDAGPTTPVVETLATGLADAIDFDAREADVVVLRASPSRLDKCAAGACSPLLDTMWMPPEDATRVNASIGYLPLTGLPSRVIVAQKPSPTTPFLCTGACDTDDPTFPGLFTVMPDLGVQRAARRHDATIPLVPALAYRRTTGWLVGGPEAWAVAQSMNPEGFTFQHTAVFTLRLGLGTVDLDKTMFDRGRNGPSPTEQPFVFAAVKTSKGAGGWTGAGGKLVDVRDPGAGIAVVPKAVAVTRNDPITADVLALGDTDESLLTYRNFTPTAPKAVKFPGFKRTSELVTTADHVGYLLVATPDAGTANVSLHYCSNKDLQADACTPAVLPLPLESVVRARTTGGSMYVMGASGGASRILRVTLPKP